MNSLARLKAIIGGDGYHLCILNDTSKLHDLIKFQLINQPIRRLDQLINQPIQNLQQLCYDNSRQLILASQKENTDYLTIEEMEQYKKILLDIHNTRDQYDKIIILYYLEHPALVNNNAFFPYELINNRDGWKVHHLHNVDVNTIDIDFCEENKLFQSFSYCLYDKKHHKSVELVDVIKNNIQKVEIILKNNIANHNDIIKYGSIKKIQTEEENEKLIISQLANDFTYTKRGVFLLKGEHTGAMSICADTYDTTSLEEKLKNISDKQIESLSTSIFKSFDSLYRLNKPDGLNIPPLELYIKNTLSVVLELVSLKMPFEPADDDIPLSIINWNDLFNDSYRKEDYIFELIDIIPDFTDTNQYKLIFGLSVSINDKIISCSASFTEKREMWREIFNVEGIQTGKKYKLKKVRFENFLSPYFDTITELQKLNNIEVPSLTIDKDYQESHRNELMKMENETVQLGKVEYANPCSYLQDTNKLKSLKDQSHLVYGNATLTNIAFLEKTENLEMSEKDDDRKTFHPFFLDLSSIGTDYPASFDMAKLEFEIKNQIIEKHILSNYYHYQENNIQWVNFLFCIEQILQSKTVNITNFQDIKKIDPKDQTIILQMICLIRKIRKKAFEIYKSINSGTETSSKFKNNVKRRYLQQLLFYSLSKLTNKDLEKSSLFYAAISALHASSELFSKKELSCYEFDSLDSHVSDNKKNIFISYCHQDQKWLEKLLHHLSPLKQNNIEIWYDKEIKTGDEWDKKIKKNIEDSNLAICLVTNNFFNSGYILEHEKTAILKKNENGELTIFPILIENCAWKSVGWLEKFQIFPRDNRPLDMIKEDDQPQVFINAVDEIAEILSCKS